MWCRGWRIVCLHQSLLACLCVFCLNYWIIVCLSLRAWISQLSNRGTQSHTFAFPVALRRHLFPSFAPSVNMCSSVTYLSLLQSQCLPVPPVCEGSCYGNTLWIYSGKSLPDKKCWNDHTVHCVYKNIQGPSSRLWTRRPEVISWLKPNGSGHFLNLTNLWQNLTKHHQCFALKLMKPNYHALQKKMHEAWAVI